MGHIYWNHHWLFGFLSLFDACFMSFCVVSLLLMTYFLFKDSDKFGIAVLVMGASIMSRVIMGFSPTVYESGTRTFLFQCIAMVIFGLLMYREFNPQLTQINQKKTVRSYMFYGDLWLPRIIFKINLIEKVNIKLYIAELKRL